MKDIKVDIDRMYEEIFDLKTSYDKIRSGLPVPLRTMVWVEQVFLYYIESILFNLLLKTFLFDLFSVYLIYSNKK